MFKKGLAKRGSMLWPGRVDVLQGPAERAHNTLSKIRKNFLTLANLQDIQEPSTNYLSRKRTLATPGRTSNHSTIGEDEVASSSQKTNAVVINAVLAKNILDDLNKCIILLESIKKEAVKEQNAKSVVNELKLKKLVRKVSDEDFGNYINQFMSQGQQNQIVAERSKSLLARETDDLKTVLSSLGLNILTIDVPELYLELDNIDDWGLDIFKVSEFSANRPLPSIAYTIFKQRNFYLHFCIEPKTLVQFMIKIEDKYHNENAYHNSIHAADVMQSAHVLLNHNVDATQTEILSILIACAIHDVDHPGFTNQYLINTDSVLASLYDDIAVLEQHHCYVGMQVLMDEDCNLLKGFERSERRVVRKMIRDMVMATDMSRHMAHFSDMKNILEQKLALPSTAEKFPLTGYKEKMSVFGTIVHCCDVSGPLKPLELYSEWVWRVKEEFYNQGDQERARGMAISAMCDRQTTNFSKCQVGFIDFIVLPLWTLWASFVNPHCKPMINDISVNRAHYADLSKQEGCAGKSSVVSTTVTANKGRTSTEPRPSTPRH